MNVTTLDPSPLPKTLMAFKSDQLMQPGSADVEETSLCVNV